MTTTVTEGQLEFTFPAGWTVSPFDSRGSTLPKHIAPVDFVIEREGDILLLEIKDPSNTKAPSTERAKFVTKMQTDQLTHEELAPKARTTWSFLYLMAQAEKPLRYVVAIGTDALSIQPPLLQNLNDRLRKRLAQEADLPWVRPHVIASAVVPALDLDQYLPGVRVKRLP